MQIAVIAGAQTTLGRAQGYRGLPVRYVQWEDPVNNTITKGMESAWTPTPEELSWMRCGSNIILTVLGETHPPVLLRVEQPSEELMDLSKDTLKKVRESAEIVSRVCLALDKGAIEGALAEDIKALCSAMLDVLEMRV